MSMSVPGGGDGDDEVMSTINTTPLVDVMLVMLIIFLITVPVIVPSVKVELPEPKNIATTDQAGGHPRSSVDVDGNYLLEGRQTLSGRAQFSREAARESAAGAAARAAPEGRPQRALRAGGARAVHHPAGGRPRESPS